VFISIVPDFLIGWMFIPAFYSTTAVVV